MKMNQNPSLQEKNKIDELKKNLKSRYWRLNNLYWIKDKKGKKIKFKLNIFQEKLYHGLWYLSIILKARQLGITTFFAILYLDAVLFKSNQTAAIIAHKQKDAQNIFEDKVKFAFNNLPLWLKESLEIKTDSREELGFRNGSKIIVTTSTRSGTIQYLHISELGYTSLKFPEKAEEIMSGALNSVEQGSLISIESTAKGRTGKFYELCEEAIKLQKSKNKLTKMDFEFFFFPWFENPEYKLNSNKSIPKELNDYFDDLLIKHHIILSEEQKQWYMAKLKTQGDNMKQEYPSTPDEAFEASIEGAYYRKQMLKAYEERRITTVPWQTNTWCDTWWDLGMNDFNVVIVTQNIGKEIHFIDLIYGEGEGLAYYVKQLSEKPYIYRNHYLPHDVNVRELGTGKTRYDQLTTLGLKGIVVVPKLSIEDGIEMVRGLFTRFWFDENKCKKLIDSLSSYRKEWDDKIGAFKSQPIHDESSHFADAVRSLGISMQDSFQEMKEEKEEFDTAKMFNEI